LKIFLLIKKINKKIIKDFYLKNIPELYTKCDGCWHYDCEDSDCDMYQLRKEEEGDKDESDDKENTDEDGKDK